MRYSPRMADRNVYDIAREQEVKFGRHLDAALLDQIQVFLETVRDLEVAALNAERVNVHSTAIDAAASLIAIVERTVDDRWVRSY